MFYFPWPVLSFLRYFLRPRELNTACHVFAVTWYGITPNHVTLCKTAVSSYFITVPICPALQQTCHKACITSIIWRRQAVRCIGTLQAGTRYSCRSMFTDRTFICHRLLIKVLSMRVHRTWWIATVRKGRTKRVGYDLWTSKVGPIKGSCCRKRNTQCRG